MTATVSNSSAVMTVQSCGKSMFTLVVVAANQKFAKRLRPVCTPGLPYKDSLVYVVFDWGIYSNTSFPDFTRHLLICSPFLILNRTYTPSLFQICFPTFKLRLIVRKIYTNF
jgi:hypothetical protein